MGGGWKKEWLDRKGGERIERGDKKEEEKKVEGTRETGGGEQKRGRGEVKRKKREKETRRKWRGRKERKSKKDMRRWKISL